MLVIEDNFKTFFNFETYIALGSFDGIHLGHISLLKKTTEVAKQNRAKSMVFTFKNHPLTVINKEIVPKLLISNETKVKLLDDYNIDIVNMANFDLNFMRISPEDFILLMLEHYKVKGFIVGFNYRFGYKNLGDVELLKKMSKKHKFALHIVEPVKYGGEIVSSSKIRNIISEDGNMNKSYKMLTRHYTLAGKVVTGKKLGRQIGFPTVNLDYNKDFVLPRGGVYYTIVEYNGIKHKGITNIGYNPTVNDEKLSIETHILNFDEVIYGEKITLYFIGRIRDEKKFSSLEELQMQLKKDKNYVKSKK